jgi:RHS repeat-associated protein
MNRSINENSPTVESHQNTVDQSVNNNDNKDKEIVTSESHGNSNSSGQSEVRPNQAEPPGKNKEGAVVSNGDSKKDSDENEDVSEVKTLNIVIQNCRIKKSDDDIAGIKVHGGVANLSITKNYIFENGGDGIRFSDSKHGGPHLIEKNIISYNRKNGIVVPKKQKITLKDNLVLSNGTGDDGGYGIKKNGNAEFDPTIITLLGNVIAFNKGNVVKDKSSQDISFYSTILDATDLNNKTTTGLEGVGILKLEDKTQPEIKLATKDYQLTNKAKFWLELIVEDFSPIVTRIYQNDHLILTSTQFFIEKETLLFEGVNVFRFEATDAFGNTTQATLNSIKLDTIPPLLTKQNPVDGVIFYSNHFPFIFNASVNSNEPILRASIQTTSALLGADLLSFSSFVTLNQEGAFTIPITASDLATNETAINLTGSLVFDNIAPIVSVTIVDNFRTNLTSIAVPVRVTEINPAWTAIYVNEEKQYETQSKQFDSPVFPLKEGENIFKVISTDAAGNISNISITHVFRDTIPPVLSSVKPLTNSVVDGIQFTVSALSNEKLSSVTVNGANFTLAADGLSFSGPFTALSEGNLNLRIEAKDLVQNTTVVEIPVLVTLKALNGQLLSVIPDEANGKLVIRGAARATRPGYTVKASSNLLNSGETTSDNMGQFIISLDPFTSATVSVYNPITNKTEYATVQYGSNTNTILSGTVRDTNNNPLVGVSVTIENSNLVTKTDGQGVFYFIKSQSTDLLTGDQILIIDGTTAIISPEGPKRKFAKTSVAITIGLSQQNVLNRSIFLTPILLDDSQPLIAVASGGVVESPYAPGVALDIPANTIQFPDGATQSVISIQTIPSEYTVIAPIGAAVPKEVIVLEPSGTTFSEPVPLTLPNTNDFEPGTDLVILTMNSASGRWEVGAGATVSENGTSIITKPGQGIRHFSPVYATIPGPVVRQIGAKDKPGADTFDGAMTSVLQLPSYKSLGETVAPSFTYKSSWAKPSALVTNLFDLPVRKIDLNLPSQTGIIDYSYQSSTKYCFKSVLFGLGLIPICVPRQEDLYTKLQYETTYTSAYASLTPQKVEAQMKTAGIQSPVYSYSNLPERAAVSFGVDLIDPSTGAYLNSGIFPYQTHYSIFFKQLIIATGSTTFKNPIFGTQSQPFNEKQLGNETDQIFPSDLSGSIFVQNYADSSIGKGWRINGVKKILNPKENKVVIEEADGSLSTFSISNTIESLTDVSGTADFNKGVGITWPEVQFMDAGAASYLSKNLINGQLRNLGSPPEMAGSISGAYGENYIEKVPYQYYVCYERFTFIGGNICLREGYETAYNEYKKSACSAHYANFKVQSMAGQLLLTPNGQLYGTDNFRSVLFSINNGAYQVLGGRFKTFLNYNGNENYQTSIDSFCNSSSEINCEPKQGTTYIKDEYNSCNITYPTNGEIPLHSDSNKVTRYVCIKFPKCVTKIVDVPQSLNHPLGIIAGRTSNTVIIADTGNHKVRIYDTTNSTTSVVAGNGGSYDTGDGGLATQAGMFHPRSLAYDALGNLYISTESGFIRKVDTRGYISTYAGNPNGVFAQSVEAENAQFNKPFGIVIDDVNGFLYVADTGHNRVVQIDMQTKIATTVAGNGSPISSGDGKSALEASLNAPTILALDDNNNLVIAESGSNKIRRVNFQNSMTGRLVFAPTAEDNSELVRNTDGTWVRTHRNGVIDNFNSLGLQTLSQDRVGRRLSYTYDAYNRLTSTVDSKSKITSYIYSGNRLASVVDPAGRRTQFRYNTSGELIEVLYPDSTTKGFEYQDGLLTKETDQRKNSTTYVYNDFHRLEKIIKPDQTTIGVNDMGSTTVGNSDGSLGQLKSIGTDENQVSDILIDSNNNQTTVEKDWQGFIYKVTDAENHVTAFKRDQKGRVIEIIRPDQSIVKNTYDQLTGDLKGVSDTATGQNESFTYDSFGQLISRTDSLGKTYINQFDPNTGLLLKEIAPGNKNINYSYNNLGQVTSKTINTENSTGLTTNYQYDQDSNLTKIQNPDTKSIYLNYDLAGNLISRKVETQIGIFSETKFTYDTFNRLTKVTSANSEVTEYSYLVTGELFQITDPKGKTTKFEYDVMGRLIKKTDTLGFVHSFEYDANGNTSLETDPNGNEKIFSYNKVNKLLQVNLPDDIIKFEYDTKGETTKATSTINQVSYTRDIKSRVTQTLSIGLNAMSTYPQLAFNYAYNANDNRTTTTTDIGSISYYYDDLNRLINLSSSNGSTYDFNYDNYGRLNSLIRPGSRTDYAYTSGGAVNSIIHSSSNVTKSFSQYDYDLRNFPTQKRSVAGTFNYTYDANGQITGSNNIIRTETFSYDSLGNRNSDIDGSYLYDEASQRLKEDWQFHYAYDNNGNLLSKIPKDQTKESFSYSYSSRNQLINVKVTEGLTGPLVREVSYAYDVLGRRMEKKVWVKDSPSGTYTRRYVYDGDNIFAEYDGNNNLLAKYTHSPLSPDDILENEITTVGVAAGLAQTEGKSHYLKDAIGTITDIVDSNGVVIQRYDYQVFGKIASIKDANGNDITQNPKIKTSFSFTGREWDQESSLYYYRARYYDPGVGRFLQVDPDPGKRVSPISVINRYIYAANGPTIFSDPSGTSVVSEYGKRVFGDSTPEINLAPVGQALIDAGHSLIAEAGAAGDRLIKDPGFQFVIILVASIVTGTTPAVLGSVLLSAIMSGVISFYNGNRSLDAFMTGVNSVLSDPTSLRNSAAIGLVAGGLKYIGTEVLELDPKDIGFFSMLFFFQSNREELSSARMSKDEVIFWNLVLLHSGAILAAPN